MKIRIKKYFENATDAAGCLKILHHLQLGKKATHPDNV